MSGGGTRLAYYLGIHAAAEMCRQTPDILLATCGGAMAGAIIQGLPDARSRKKWLTSRQMYEYMQSLRGARHQHLLSMILQASQRWFIKSPALYIPDLFSGYLFEMPSELPLPSPCPDGPVLAIVGARLRFTQDDTGKTRRDEVLFTEVIFANERVKSLLTGFTQPLGTQQWSAGTIAPSIEVLTRVAIQDAVRISISDIFYLPAYPYREHFFTGGLIDLYPLEIARQVSAHIAMEQKAPFDQIFSIPAIRSVFGIDGNRRLRYIHAQNCDVWIDTSDMRTRLPACINRRLNLMQSTFQILAPPSYREYVAIIEAQWQYGFQRGMEGFRRMPTVKPVPRHHNHHSWAT